MPQLVWNKQAEYVNSLNVFPVPDGDTGTNMGMTIENGAKEVADKPGFHSREVEAAHENAQRHRQTSFLSRWRTHKQS